MRPGRIGEGRGPAAATSALFLALFHPVAASAQPAPGGYDYGGPMMWGWGWSGMILGPFFMFIMLAVLVAAVVLVVRWLGAPWPPAHHASPGAPPNRAALDILNERFARGEIDQAEYENKRRLISQS